MAIPNLYTSRSLPQPVPDTLAGNQRGDRYGGATASVLNTTKHILADEGSYYVCSSGIGTQVAYAAAITAFSDTGPSFVIYNGNASGGNRIYLDYLRLILGGTAPTATVSLELAVKTDTISRVPTNANQYTNPTLYNVNSDDSRSSKATVYAYVAANAMVVAASSGSARTVARGHIPTSLGIVGDEYLFQFGATERASIPGLTATRSTAVARIVGDCAPVIIGPGTYAVVYLWWLTAATNIPSFEFELGYWER